MAKHKWLMHVVEDLERFAELENLKKLKELLGRAKVAIREDEQALELERIKRLEHLSRE